MAPWVLGLCVLVTVVTPVIKAEITSGGCGRTKECFQSPRRCSPRSCEFFLSWRQKSLNSIEFEMTGNAESYVAMGFSKSGAMNNSDVYACTMRSEVVRSRNTIMNVNDGTLPLKGVSNVDVAVIDGRIECTFTRQASLNDNDNTFYGLTGNNSYYIIMSKSSSFLSSDGNIQYHFGGKVVGPLTTFQSQSTITAAGCGITKGCFRSPEDCTSSATCSFFLSWTVQEDGSNVFEMAGNVGTHVAVGFSKSGAMRDSDVYACTNNLEVVRSRNTVANMNEPSVIKGVSNVAVNLLDGRIECTFTRQASLNDGDETYYDLSKGNEYYIIMSKSGLNLDDDGNIKYHFGGKVPGPLTSFASIKPPAPMIPDGDGSGDGCGTTKGCFRSPSGCSGPDDCEFFVSWSRLPDGNHVFQVSGAAETFVALGFSRSGKMSNSDVYACTKNNEVVRSRNTVLNQNRKSDEPMKGISDVSVSVADGRLQCTFTRKASMGGNDDTYYNLGGDNKYNIIMSKSSGDLNADGSIKYHVGGRVQGPEVSFNDFAEAKPVFNNKELMQKAHGCLMIIAWVGFASSGIIMARFFKPIAPERKICGTAVWFAVHRSVMVNTLCATVAAFVLIFIATEGFVSQSPGSGTDTRFIHAIMGTVVTGLAIINPIMALFRPHPGTPRRPIFNWAHWAVGTCAHSAAMTTICFAFVSVGMSRPILPGLPDWLFWVMIVFIAVDLCVRFILECKRCQNKSTASSDNIPLANGTGKQDIQVQLDDSKDTTDAGPAAWIFFVYAFVVIIFVVTMVATIVTA